MSRLKFEGVGFKAKALGSMAFVGQGCLGRGLGSFGFGLRGQPWLI